MCVDTCVCVCMCVCVCVCVGPCVNIRVKMKSVQTATRCSKRGSFHLSTNYRQSLDGQKFGAPQSVQHVTAVNIEPGEQAPVGEHFGALKDGRFKNPCHTEPTLGTELCPIAHKRSILHCSTIMRTISCSDFRVLY